jgi:hypothetical protein
MENTPAQEYDIDAMLDPENLSKDINTIKFKIPTPIIKKEEPAPSKTEPITLPQEKITIDDIILEPKIPTPPENEHVKKMHFSLKPSEWKNPELKELENAILKPLVTKHRKNEQKNISIEPSNEQSKAQQNPDRERKEKIELLLVKCNEFFPGKYSYHMLEQYSESQLIEFSAELEAMIHKIARKKMTNPHFVTTAGINTAGYIEQAVPGLLNGWKDSLHENEKNIEQCIDQMMKSGDLSSVEKYLEPKYQLLYFVGLPTFATLMANLQSGKPMLKQEIKKKPTFISEEPTASFSKSNSSSTPSYSSTSSSSLDSLY